MGGKRPRQGSGWNHGLALVHLAMGGKNEALNRLEESYRTGEVATHCCTSKSIPCSIHCVAIRVSKSWPTESFRLKSVRLMSADALAELAYSVSTGKNG